MHILQPIATTENCRYCLMCRHVCPVGYVTRSETLSPHGWGLTIASVRRGLLQWNRETSEVLFSCADCGLCRAHCATDQPLPDAIAAAREEVVELKQAPPAVYRIEQALQQWSNPYTQQQPWPVKQRGDVALFVGDAALFLWPSALEAAQLLLSAAGVQPVLVGAGRNNGYLASSLGLRSTAEALAQANLEDLQASGAGRLLVLTPGDYYTFSRLYEDRLGIAWPREIELVELVPFLAGQLEAGALRLRRSEDTSPYAYCDPTHSARVPGRDRAPRRLLATVLGQPGLELFWRGERAHPAGDTALQFTQPELADQLTLARLQDAANHGAFMLISEDPGSLAHLNRHASRFALKIQGLYELLARHLA
ncbi:MAG: hypothetical protein KatS3mg057_0356 [Herpetosiphonaceae bacterium]|nr:MAG: hypothetical protein KatS3mg057_0356 [Herpetosiphonaceae bacterium]